MRVVVCRLIFLIGMFGVPSYGESPFDPPPPPEPMNPPFPAGTAEERQKTIHDRAVSLGTDLQERYKHFSDFIKNNDLVSLSDYVLRNHRALEFGYQVNQPDAYTRFGAILSNGVAIFGIRSVFANRKGPSEGIYLLDEKDVYWTSSINKSFRKVCRTLPWTAEEIEKNGNWMQQKTVEPPQSLIESFKKWRDGELRDIQNVFVSEVSYDSDLIFDTALVPEEISRLNLEIEGLNPEDLEGYPKFASVRPFPFPGERKYRPYDNEDPTVEFDAHNECRDEPNSDSESCAVWSSKPQLKSKKGLWKAKLFADPNDYFSRRKVAIASLANAWIISLDKRIFRVDKNSKKSTELHSPVKGFSVVHLNSIGTSDVALVSEVGEAGEWVPHPSSVGRFNMMLYHDKEKTIQNLGCFAWDMSKDQVALHNGARISRKDGKYFLEDPESKRTTKVLACAEATKAENNLGYDLYKKKKYEEALVHFDKSVQYGPANRTAIFNLICTRSLLGRPLQNSDLHWLDRLLPKDDAKVLAQYQKKLLEDPDLGNWRQYAVFIKGIEGERPSKY